MGDRYYYEDEIASARVRGPRLIKAIDSDRYYYDDRPIAANNGRPPPDYRVRDTAEAFIEYTHNSDLTRDDVHLPEYVLDDVGATFLPPTPEGRGSSHPVGASSLLDYLARELHRYREAVVRMGRDIVHLTEDVRYLDAENSALRQSTGYMERDTHVIESGDFRGSELQLQYAALMERYNEQEQDLKRYKDSVHKLQAELQSRNDDERSKRDSESATRLQLQDQITHQSERIKKLEEACRKQETVITEMELQLSEKSGKEGEKEASLKLLLSENKRLREELKRHMDESRRYYNEYADYLNRYWNPAAKDIFEVKENGSVTNGASPILSPRPTRHREFYNSSPQYHSYRTPEDILKENGLNPTSVRHSGTDRSYTFRLPPI